MTTFLTQLVSNYYNFDIIVEIGILIIIYLGILVISAKNPMYSIVYLIGVFVFVAIALVYIGLSIMSLLYLLIYVGAIAILFLFILSLLNIRVAELHSGSNVNDIPLMLIVPYILYRSISLLIPNYSEIFTLYDKYLNIETSSSISLPYSIETL